MSQHFRFERGDFFLDLCRNFIFREIDRRQLHLQTAGYFAGGEAFDDVQVEHLLFKMVGALADLFQRRFHHVFFPLLVPSAFKVEASLVRLLSQQVSR